MTPYIIKTTGLSGEVTHYINLSRVDRIDLSKLSNCTAYKLYVHSSDSDLNIVISSTEAGKIMKYLDSFI